LLDNNYPLAFIFAAITIILKFHFHNYNNPITNKYKIKNKYFAVPYIRSVSESFLLIASNINLKTAFIISNTLNKFIKVGKDRLDSLAHQDIVYKILCLDCDASYVSQMKRHLYTRVHEHSSNINKKTGSPSIILDTGSNLFIISIRKKLKY